MHMHGSPHIPIILKSCFLKQDWRNFFNYTDSR